MIISKAPMRISFFGGSTDYESYYSQNGSLIIGTTINKYAYSILRHRPKIVGDESVVTYSKLERIKNINDIQNPLIRETFKFYGITGPIEMNFATDVPSKTGLGGSSSCCVSLIKAIDALQNRERSRIEICKDAIKIERQILNEPGGIQDQIWACFGGFNKITIEKNGEFLVEPINTSYDFMRYLESSLMLIYSGKQRENNEIARHHNDYYKLNILEYSSLALKYFINENIEYIGSLLYESWLDKRKLSNNISNDKIDEIIDDVMNSGAYGAKLLGSGGAGFILVICNRNVKKKLKDKYNKNILDFEFENSGVSHVIV